MEQAAVVLGLQEAGWRLRGRRAVWFEDNSVVLSGLVKGSSGSPELDDAFAAIHLWMAAIKTCTWFEYIESAANWSDGASGLLEKDPWCAEQP